MARQAFTAPNAAKQTFLCSTSTWLKPTAQQIELLHKRARRVFLGNVGEHVIAIGLVLELGQVAAVLVVHQRFDGRHRAFDQVEDPDRAPGPQGGEEFGEDVVPLGVRSQVVQHGRGQDDVKRLDRQLNFARPLAAP